jgi:hypothetical protein
MKNRVYCTYFDHNYLARGVALYHSLQRHAPGSRLWVLCLSEPCYRTIVELNLPNLIPRRLTDFETADPEVAATRPHRSTIEYYFTLSPAWKLYVLNQEPLAEWVTYLDGDLYFFASPDPIYNEMGNAAFGIIPHRFPDRLAHMLRFGIYNVGWVSTRRCEEGIAALSWWRERCIEWCYDRVEDGRFADQRYLDRLPELFPNVHIVRHLGANLAPWNIANYRVAWLNETVMIDGRYPLLFFHFQGVKRVGRYYFNSHRLFKAPFSDTVRQRIYEPYILALAAAEVVSQNSLATERIESVRKPSRVNARDHVLNILRNARLTAFRRLDVVTGRVIDPMSLSR